MTVNPIIRDRKINLVSEGGSVVVMSRAAAEREIISIETRLSTKVRSPAARDALTESLSVLRRGVELAKANGL